MVLEVPLVNLVNPDDEVRPVSWADQVTMVDQVQWAQLVPKVLWVLPVQSASRVK